MVSAMGKCSRKGACTRDLAHSAASWKHRGHGEPRWSQDTCMIPMI